MTEKRLSVLMASARSIIQQEGQCDGIACEDCPLQEIVRKNDHCHELAMEQHCGKSLDSLSEVRQAEVDFCQQFLDRHTPTQSPVICDPNDPRAKALLGKPVFFFTNIDKQNDEPLCSYLVAIHDNWSFPFESKRFHIGWRFIKAVPPESQEPMIKIITLNDIVGHHFEVHMEYETSDDNDPAERFIVDFQVYKDNKHLGVMEALLDLQFLELARVHPSGAVVVLEGAYRLLDEAFHDDTIQHQLDLQKEAL